MQASVEAGFCNVRGRRRELVGGMGAVSEFDVIAIQRNTRILMNLDAVPVVDTHAHPFPPDQRSIPWSRMRDALSEAVRAPTTSDNDSSLLVRMFVRRLSRLLGTPASAEPLMAVRNQLARDPAAYHAQLWTDANIAAVLIDSGYPANLVSASAFSSVIPCPVHEGYRIEGFAKGPTQSVPFDYDAYDSFVDLLDAFRNHLDHVARKPGFCFYKSIIAYRTGLHLTVPAEAEVLDAWKERPEYRSAGEKKLRDFLFHQTALKALEHDRAFQVHTGHTAHDQPWGNANPIEMTLFLNQPLMNEVQFVLVHGGYPFNTQAGYITSVYPNVFLDLSLMIPWSSIGIARRIEETFESGPTSKVMYGSDAIMVPEMFWISAHLARRALGTVLDRLIDEDMVDASGAMEIARDVLYRTARRVYGVDIEEEVGTPG